MKTKLIIPLTLATTAIIMEFFWLALLVCLISVADIVMGVYLVFKLKEEEFSWSRFLEGILKMIAYAFFIGLGFILSEKIFGGQLFEIKHLIPKSLSMVFVVLEAQSIDKKRVRLGKKPLLDVIRNIIKTFKEIKGSIKNV